MAARARDLPNSKGTGVADETEAPAPFVHRLPPLRNVAETTASQHRHLPPEPASFLPVPQGEETESDSQYMEPAEWTQSEAGTVMGRVKAIELRAKDDQASVAGPHLTRGSLKRERTVKFVAQPSEMPAATVSAVVHGGVTAGVVSIGGRVVIRTEDRPCPAARKESRTVRSNYINMAGRLKTETEKNYISTVNDATRLNTEHDVRSNYKHILKPVKKIYSAGCAFIKLNYMSDFRLRDATPQQIEVYYAVTLDNVHEAINGHAERHVMLLGGPGDGKTVAAKRYARLALDNRVPELYDVELVHYVHGSAIASDRENKPFDLLFNMQLGSCVTNPAIMDAGEKWVTENPEKVLLILDGLDRVKQSTNESDEKIALTTPAKAFTIIRNLFRGDIYKNMWVLSTSRWDWMWQLPRSELPARAIELKGFSPVVVNALLRDLVESDKHCLVKSVIARFPGIQELCSVPAFLLSVAKILNESPSDLEHSISQPAILLKLFVLLKTSTLSTARNSEVVRRVMALAYHSAKTKVLHFSHAEAEDLHDVKLTETEHFLIVKPAPKHFDVAFEAVTKFQMQYRFRCQILRDMLAALHIVAQIYGTFKEAMTKEINTASFELVQDLVHGIVMDGSLSQAVTTFTECDVDFEVKRKCLTKLLTNRLSNPLCDIRTVHLLYDCKDIKWNLKKNSTTEIRLEVIHDPGNAHAALSVTRQWSQIKKLKAIGLCVDSTSLGLLHGAYAADIEVTRLKITGEIFHYELENLSLILQQNKGIKSVFLDHYSIRYIPKMREVTIDSIKENDIEILTGLLHHAPDTTKINVKMCKIMGENRAHIAKLDALEDLARSYTLEVHSMNIEESMTNATDVFIDMLTGIAACKVHQILLGSIRVSGCRNRSGDFQLTMYGNLTDSDQIVNVISKGRSYSSAEEQYENSNTVHWKCISTSDFMITFNDQMMEVVDQYDTTENAFRILCSFMVKLKYVRLKCSQLTVMAEYKTDDTTDQQLMKKLELVSEYDPPAVDSCYIGLCRYAIFSNAETIKIGPMEFASKMTENGKCALIILLLDGESLDVLYSLLANESVDSIEVVKCIAMDGIVMDGLLNLVGKMELRIQNLEDTSDLLQHVEDFLALYKSTGCHSATLGAGEEVMQIFELNQISIKSITAERLNILIPDLLHVFSSGTSIEVSYLTLARDSTLQTLYQRAHRASNEHVALKIVEMSVGLNFLDAAIQLMDLSKIARLQHIATKDTTIDIEHSSSGEMEVVTLHDVSLKAVHLLEQNYQRRWDLFVDNCEIHTDQVDDAREELTTFVALFNRVRPCIVDTLILNVPIIEGLGCVRQTMESGNPRALVSRIEPGLAVTRDIEGQRFVVTISKVSVLNLESIATELGKDFQPGQIAINECVVGAEDQEAVFQQLAGIKSEEFRKSLMDNAKSLAQKKIVEGLNALENFAKRNPITIATVSIQGDIPDHKALIRMTRDISISTVTSENATIRIGDEDVHGLAGNSLTLTSATLEELELLERILDSNWSIKLERLDLQDLSSGISNQRFMEARETIQSERMEVRAVEVSCCLSSVSDEMVFVTHHLCPTVIRTLDYLMNIRHLSNGHIQIRASLRIVDHDPDHSALIKFARETGADFSVSVDDPVLADDAEELQGQDDYDLYESMNPIDLSEEISTETDAFTNSEVTIPKQIYFEQN